MLFINIQYVVNMKFLSGDKKFALHSSHKSET
jgi:hypothetical protein